MTSRPMTSHRITSRHMASRRMTSGRRSATWLWSLRTARIVTAVGLAIDAYVHWDLAPVYAEVRGTIDEGVLFRAEAVVALLTAVAVVATGRRAAYLAGLAVGASALTVLLLARYAGRRFQGRSGATIQVVHRQPLSRGSGVAVVTVGDRVLVLGTTEHQVSLLTELDPHELDLSLVHDPAAEEPRVRAVPAHRGAPLPTKDGPLAGSVLSPDTWRQALRVARGNARDAS